MELGRGIWLATIALIVLLQSELVSSDGNLQNGSPAAAGVENKKLQEKLNATVSDVIKLMSESSLQGDGGPEHGKKSRIYARKGVVMNETIASSTTTTTTTTSTPIVAVTVPKASEAQPNSNITTTSKTAAAAVNSTTSNSSIAVGDTSAAVTNATTASIKVNSTLPTTPAVKNVTSSVSPPESVASKPTATTNTSTTATTATTTSTTTTTNPTTTTTTTTTTTSTTTKPPRKPKITYSVDDEPKLIQAAKPGYTSGGTGGSGQQSDANGRLHVEEPLAELSKEYIPPAMQGPPRGHREYVVPVVTLIFAIPLLMGLFLLSYRRAKEFWLTRHYRRMDFLVDGMYNY